VQSAVESFHISNLLYFPFIIVVFEVRHREEGIVIAFVEVVVLE
jgi:hypothetical protein